MESILLENWSELLLALIAAASTYTALTDSPKDDKVMNVLKRIVQAIVLGSTTLRKKD